MSKYNIPDSINKHIDGKAYTTNEIGMSGSSVRVFDDYVLKIVSRDPEELLTWLEENRPDFEPVLSHGDFCLPNIFIDDNRISGFIDLGDTGVGDKWRDIALCYRSLKHNFDGTFGGKVYPDFDPDILFEALGITPNREKIRWYTLLDELY